MVYCYAPRRRAWPPSSERVAATGIRADSSPHDGEGRARFHDTKLQGGWAGKKSRLSANKSKSPSSASTSETAPTETINYSLCSCPKATAAETSLLDQRPNSFVISLDSLCSRFGSLPRLATVLYSVHSRSSPSARPSAGITPDCCSPTRPEARNRPSARRLLNQPVIQSTNDHRRKERKKEKEETKRKNKDFVLARPTAYRPPRCPVSYFLKSGNSSLRFFSRPRSNFNQSLFSSGRRGSCWSAG